MDNSGPFEEEGEDRNDLAEGWFILIVVLVAMFWFAPMLERHIG